VNACVSEGHFVRPHLCVYVCACVCVKFVCVLCEHRSFHGAIPGILNK